MGTMIGMVQVRRGDSLSRIAKRYGIANWRDIYDAPGNAAFRQAFPDPDNIDYISHDGTRTPVNLFVPTRLRWADQPLAARILNPESASTVHEPTAPTGTERKVVKSEPGVLRHRATLEFPSEWQVKPELTVTPIKGAKRIETFFMTQTLEWDIQLRGGFGLTPAGEVTLGGGKGTSEGQEIVVATDGESLALDLMGKVSIEVGKVLSTAINNGTVSVGLSAEGGVVGLSASANAPRTFIYLANGAPYDVTVTTTTVPVARRNTSHVRYSLKISPTAEAKKAPAGLGDSTIKLDVVIRYPEWAVALLPVPERELVRSPAPEASPGWWVRVREAMQRGHAWAVEQTIAMARRVAEAVDTAVSFLAQVALTLAGLVVLAFVVGALAPFAAEALAAFAVLAVVLVIHHVATKPVEQRQGAPI